MNVCKQCNTPLDDISEQGLYSYDLQKGYERIYFCSKECLKSYWSKKFFWLIFSLALGALFAIVLLPQIGGVSLIFTFMPYTIRQLRHTVSGSHEILQFIIVFLAGYTLIYPLYKLIQEIREYFRIKDILDEGDS